MQDSNNAGDRMKGNLSNAENGASKPPDSDVKAISPTFPLQDDEEEGQLDGPASEGLPGYLLTFHFLCSFQSCIILLIFI